MSRRSVPKFAPNDLRDHAEPERIDRIWNRLEQNLGGLKDAPQRKSSGAWVTLLAATLSAFGIGIGVGKVLWKESAAPLPQAVASPDTATFVDVLAAGSQERTLPLPGGGHITLSPETTVELERAANGSLTLRLVRGEAEVDTASLAKSPELAIVAGEASLSPSGPSHVRVRRNQDDLDVTVNNGSARLSSPAGSRELVRGDRVQSVPLRTDVATAPTGALKPRLVLPMIRRPNEPAIAPETPEAAVVSANDWRGRLRENDYAGALDLLQKQPGGLNGAIAASKSATELMTISDIARKGGQQAAAISALTRVVDSFPSDPNAQVAAFVLGQMYEKAGQTALAQTFYDKARSLSPEGALAEDALCKKIQAEHRAAHKDEAVRLGNEYLNKYPNGPCKEIVLGILSGGEPAEGDESHTPETISDDAGAPAAPSASQAPPSPVPSQ